MKHRDVSQWSEHDRKEFLQRNFACLCEEHRQCIRDQTDEEICGKMAAKLMFGDDAAAALRDLETLQETPLPTERVRKELLAKAVALLSRFSRPR